MADEIPKIEETPKAALASFIAELEEYYYPWYDSETNRLYYFWTGAQWLALISGFASALLAACLKGEQISDWGYGRIALIVLPLLGSLASTFIVQSRVGELEALRESGRETIQRLANQARVDFAAATSPEQFTEVHRDLVTAVSALEKEQSRGFQRIVPKMMAFSSQKPPQRK